MSETEIRDLLNKCYEAYRYRTDEYGKEDKENAIKFYNEGVNEILEAIKDIKPTNVSFSFFKDGPGFNFLLRFGSKSLFISTYIDKDDPNGKDVFIIVYFGEITALRRNEPIPKAASRIRAALLTNNKEAS